MHTPPESQSVIQIAFNGLYILSHLTVLIAFVGAFLGDVMSYKRIAAADRSLWYLSFSHLLRYIPSAFKD